MLIPKLLLGIISANQVFRGGVRLAILRPQAMAELLSLATKRLG